MSIFDPISLLNKLTYLAIALPIACLTLPSSGFAAERHDLTTDGNALNRLRQATSSLQAFDGPDFSQVARSALDLEETSDLRLERKDVLPNGKQTFRFEQVYGGVPVWGERIIINQSASGAVEAISGVAIRKLGLVQMEAFAPVSVERAIEDSKLTAKNAAADGELKIVSDVAHRQIIYVSPTGDAHPAYEISFSAITLGQAKKTLRPFFIIDAQTGKQLLQWNGLARVKLGQGPGGNQKIGQYTYGKDAPSLDVEEIGGGRCQFSTTRVFTEDMGNKLESNSLPYSYNCFSNTSRPINGGFSPLNDAHYFSQLTLEMFEEWYRSPVFQHRLHVRVHYGSQTENATWDGQHVTLGDGASNMYPLVSPDIIAHEIAHGFTERNSGLRYADESGGINEAFSDMAAEAIKLFIASKKSVPVRLEPFLVGDQVMKSGTALRYMCTPENDGRSVSHVGQYRAGMDVHYSSGIFNKAFCFLSQAAGWDVRKAFEVFLVANRTQWTPNATFVSAAQGVANAANLLGYERHEIVSAFNQVGVRLESIVATSKSGVTDQSIPSAEDALSFDLENACGYFGEELPRRAMSLAGSEETEQAIRQIVEASGLAQNFRLVAAEIPNAAASITAGVRTILYSPSFLRKLQDLTGSKWTAIGILAHEIGHHLNGHTLSAGGSRPKLELEADYFSGFVLQRMGASIDQTTKAMNVFGPSGTSLTHPAKDDRIQAISTGWRTACRKDPDCFLEPDAVGIDQESVDEHGLDFSVPVRSEPNATDKKKSSVPQHLSR